jgi:formylglycine-generating enzyme required for sulfatase activity
LPLTPVLILKATLGQKPKNQPLSSLIILKKSPAIIVTGNRGVSGASHNYVYSGSNDSNAVAWTLANSSSGTKAVGAKMSNELGIYEMSGNVWEWCGDIEYTSDRRIRGGSWNVNTDNAAVTYRGRSIPDHRYFDIGFRVARSSGN